MNKRILLTSVMSLVLAVSMMFGATFALFTSESKTDISVTSGTVEVDADVTLASVYSPTTINMNGVITGTDNAALAEDTFANGGTVDVTEGVVTITNMTPGDKATFKVTMTNGSNVAFMQRMIMSCTDADKAFFNELLFGLSDTVDGTVTYYSDLSTAWEKSADVYGNETTVEKYLTIEMPGNMKNKWQGKTCNAVIAVEAVQGNAEVVNGTSTLVYAVNDQATLDAALAVCEDGATIYVVNPVDELTVNLTEEMTLTMRGYKIGTLNVTAPNATVHVYNDIDTINGDVIAHHSLYVYGEVKNMDIASGRVIVSAGAEVETLTISANEGKTVTVDVPAETSVVREIVVAGEENSAVQLNLRENIQVTPEVSVSDENQAEVKEVVFNEYPNNADELVAMIENAEDGAVVVLSGDIIFDSVEGGVSGQRLPLITIRKDITLDMNGMTIGISESAVENGVVGIPVLVEVADGANVVLANGNIDTDIGYGCYGVHVKDGKVTIESGTYTGAPTAVQVTKGELVINGGHFELGSACAAAAPDMAKYLINCVDADYANGTASVSICGGTFVGYNPANNASEGEGTNYVGAYYDVSENNGVYTIVEREDDNLVFIHNLADLESFRDAVNAGTTYAGKMVVLTADIDLGNREWVAIGSLNKPFCGSFDGQNHTISNLKITKEIGNIAASNRQGLFGTIKASGKTTFSNLTLHNADVVAGYHVGAMIASVEGSSQLHTGTNHFIMNNLRMTGYVTVEGYEGVGGLAGSGNIAEISDIVVDVEEGSYVSSWVAGRENSFNIIGSVKAGGYISTINNITSNMDVKGKTAGVGGLFGVIGGNGVECNISNVSYTGTVSVKTSMVLQWNYSRYQYNGLIIGSPRFTIVADQDTCTSTGKLALYVEDDVVMESNDMGEAYVWGEDLFGGSRDNAYTNKSYSTAAASSVSTDVALPESLMNTLEDEAEEDI